MDNKLLELRLKKHQNLFINHKDKYQKAAAWERVLLDFNMCFDINMQIDPLKRKFRHLNGIYRTKRSEQVNTGNDVENKIEYPENWTQMHECFQNYPGLAGQCLGDSDVRCSYLDTDFETDAEEETVNKPDKPFVARTPAHDAKRPKKRTPKKFLPVQSEILVKASKMVLLLWLGLRILKMPSTTRSLKALSI
jgi:hypothetical protein